MSDLILASASSRRARLLAQAGVPFTVAPTAVDESWRPGEMPRTYVLRLAEAKALAAGKPFHARAFVLAADTVVCLDGRVLGKPLNQQAAARHLRMLSGRRHAVITAFCLASPDREVLALTAVETLVTFRPLREAEIEDYAAAGEGLDKAGSYAIQGDGGFLVDRVEGSYTNIVGLPLRETLSALRTFNIFTPPEDL